MRVRDNGSGNHHAVIKGNLEAAQYLLENKADVNERGPGPEESTPLMLAAANLDLPMVECLLAHGARLDMSFANADRKTALSEVLYYMVNGSGSRSPSELKEIGLKMAKFLIDQGSPKNIVIWNGALWKHQELQEWLAQLQDRDLADQIQGYITEHNAEDLAVSCMGGAASAAASSCDS